MILVAPALLAASIYMSLGRIIRLIQAEHHSIVRIGWLTKIFILGDVASFVTQAMGAVVLSQHEEDSLSKGSNIVIIGPAIQIVFFGLFLVTAIVFHVRTNRHPTDRSRHPDIPWRRHVWVLYAASAIILIRCLFRFIEYRDISSSEKSYLATKEWPNYIFDALLMLVVLILFFVYHPSEITALRRPRGGVAMKYLHAHLVGPINDHWRSLPQPNLGPKVMYQHGDQIARMSMHAPRNVRLAKEAIRGP